jgi:hypothetical protein
MANANLGARPLSFGFFSREPTREHAGTNRDQQTGRGLMYKWSSHQHSLKAVLQARVAWKDARAIRIRTSLFPRSDSLQWATSIAQSE